MKRFIYKTFFFLSFLLLLLIIKKNITPFYIGDPIFKAKFEDFINNKENFNTISFGSSRIYRHLNTTLLDSLLNNYYLSTYNLAVGATYNPESYYLYEELIQTLDSGDIKLTFVELQT